MIYCKNGHWAGLRLSGHISGAKFEMKWNNRVKKSACPMILIFTILCYLHGALSDTTQTFHSYKLETYLWPLRLVPNESVFQKRSLSGIVTESSSWKTHFVLKGRNEMEWASQASDNKGSRVKTLGIPLTFCLSTQWLSVLGKKFNFH